MNKKAETSQPEYVDTAKLQAFGKPSNDNSEQFPALATVERQQLSLEKHLAESTTSACQLSAIAVLCVVSLARRNAGRGSRRNCRRHSTLFNSGVRQVVATIAIATSPNSWTWHSVRLISTPEAEIDFGICLFVDARELGSWTRSAGAASGDLDLRAARKQSG